MRASRRGTPARPRAPFPHTAPCASAPSAALALRGKTRRCVSAGGDTARVIGKRRGPGGAGEPGGGLPRGLALLVAGAFFMEILDGTVIAPAAPLIAADLGHPRRRRQRRDLGLPGHRRRADPDQRVGRRPVRRAAGLRHRDRAVHPRLGGLRARPGPDDAHRDPGAAGCRRRADGAGRAAGGAARHGEGRPDQGDRLPDLARAARARARARDRRRAQRVRLVALDLRDQRAARRRGPAARAPAGARPARRRAAAAAGPARVRARGGRDRGADGRRRERGRRARSRCRSSPGERCWRPRCSPSRWSTCCARPRRCSTCASCGSRASGSRPRAARCTGW